MPPPDLDIEITSEEDDKDTFEPALEKPMTNVAIMGPCAPAEIRARLPEDFLGKNDDTTRWLLVMKAYFTINREIYQDDRVKILVLLNKMSKGRGVTFIEGWYNKLANTLIPESQKMYKFCDSFEETFILKDLKDMTCQTVYSLSMDQFNGDFDKYATAFRLVQGWCRVDNDSILVDALQQGVSNQLTVMMTAAAPPDDQKVWKWEQWLNKAGEFYQNVIRLQNLQSRKNTSIPASSGPQPPWRDPYAMDVDQINLTLVERAEHMRNHKCFICHRVGCHSTRIKGYPQKKEGGEKENHPLSRLPPQGRTREIKTEDSQVQDFMKCHKISAWQALKLLGTYYDDKPANKWGETGEESVNELTMGFWKGRMDQHHHFPQTFSLYL